MTDGILQVSRLRDTLECPESSYYFVDDEIATLPDHLLRDTPMSDFLAVGLERLKNDPNWKEKERLGWKRYPLGDPLPSKDKFTYEHQCCKLAVLRRVCRADRPLLVQGSALNVYSFHTDYIPALCSQLMYTTHA